MAVDRRQLIAFGIAFMVGSAIFHWGMSSLPMGNIHLRIAGIDTDLGITTINEQDGLAEASWPPNPTKLRVDPDLAGEEIFTLQIGIDKFTAPLDRAVCGKPDIIVTITNPRGPEPEIVGEPLDFTAPSGEQFKLYKTTFWVILRTDADIYAANNVIGEISYQVQGQLGITGIQISPPFGGAWEGDAYVEYSVTNVLGAFIYEARINRDPTVGIITYEVIDPSLSLDAPAVPGVAHAHYQSMGAVSFYDSIDGNVVTDFVALRTPRGILPLGGKLAVGADPIMEGKTFGYDFTGWNIFNTAIKYQVAIVVAVPLEFTLDEEGNPKSGEDVLPGSTEYDPMGDPIDYDTYVNDTLSSWDKFKSAIPKLIPDVGGFLDAIFLIILAVISLVVIIVVLWVLLKLLK